MFALRSAACAAVCTASWMLLGQSVQAQSYEHIDSLALKLQKQSATLYHEFKAHYRHTPGYRHLMNDAAQMYHLAAHLHEVAHHDGDVHHMREDLERLDKRFHHLEDLVDDIEDEADDDDDHYAHGRGDYGHGGYGRGGRRHLSRHRDYHDGGHIHGNTRHVHNLLEKMEDTLHHLQEDLDEIAEHDHGDDLDFSVGGRRFLIEF